jgi:hypothetical protein
VNPDDPANIGWTGPLSFLLPDGSFLTGILIGLLPPSPIGARGSVLEAIVVVQEGTGPLATAPGIGEAAITGLTGPFDMVLQTRPFALSQGPEEREFDR